MDSMLLLISAQLTDEHLGTDFTNNDKRHFLNNLGMSLFKAMLWEKFGA